MTEKTKRRVLLYKNRSAIFLQNFIFGVEDSLVSTVGVLSGIAIAGTSVKTVILAGVVLIFVESFSMGVGSFLSEHTAEEFIAQQETPGKISLLAALVMFCSYFLAGFIPLSPYLFFNFTAAFKLSILFSLIALFVLGAISAKFSHTNKIRHGLEMLFIGGLAIVLGVVIGTLINKIE
ncbi:MAG: hypothetical protein US71_C0001G0008 [Parcubacteria group bacterium GW2011_GWD2_38_12]|nr:MAG: hypothetical protein US06_C0001G0008 [Parcubacteria group bacterium GW2011_GWC2_36_17]KKQ38771.1 MAG: hypothetical protein US56_C0036G0009 [Candidatus Moranbacteria bacterium GW2011_GWF2_37_7]KKQ52805.1 MAG: hypothetical protein US71_C0001G0008 [Parcubacteria group bacterium GW2011_GWD2_38_12]KKQ59009.1 MAG: hypothetical protein US79_C0001G0008 [Parcubacteria group bacterium GW2011_GWC1_38_17]KKQ59257.1 MAG: hypothetical protein US78_C0007G0017 [Parcubacteria group bacterium GW2011_GWD1